MKSPLGSLFNKAPSTPVPYVSRSSRATLPWMHRRGAEAQLRAMSSVGTLFAIVNRTAKAEADVEWKLWRKAKSGKDEDRVEVTSHAALDLWNKPNPFFTQSVFVEAGAQHKLLTGEQWWVIARDRRFNVPLEMWPVRPDRMEPVPDPERFIAGYMYTGPSGEKVALRIEDVIFIRTPHPEDPYRGIGPVQALLTDLDATRYSAEWNRNFFLNSAEPGGIIEVPNRLGDDEFDELRERWNEQHKGVANAHRVAILEHGKWVDRKFSQRDMQFAELRSISQEIIREAFGFPKSMLGSTEDVNKATAQVGEVMFARWLVKPEAGAIRDALNHSFLPLFGKTAEGLEFDFVNPVPADLELESKQLTAKAEAVKLLVEAGVYGPEALAAVDLPEMSFGAPDADPDRELLIKLVTDAPAALAPIILPILGIEVPPPAAPEPASAPPPAETPAAPEARGSVSLFDIARARPRTPHAHRPALQAAAEDPEDDDELDAVRTALDEALQRLIEEWAPIAEAQRDELVEQVRQAVEDDDTEALSALTVSTEDAAATLIAALVAMYGTAAGQAVEEAAALDVTVEQPPPPEDDLGPVGTAIVVLLGAWLAAAAGREALRLLVPGVGAEAVAAGVRSLLEGLPDRPLLDALGGALHRAANMARLTVLSAAQALSSSLQLAASEKHDQNACEPCKGLDGTVFEGASEAWAAYGTGGYRDCKGGDRCRGTVVLRRDSAQ
ncbi:phage portal protein [Streptomyces sp. NPDC021218]|uniref:phage portal protein n=1 Tax=Streptomyces sp. NPDC021218 TaxID=3365119 RepID=UPI0037B2C094